MSSSLYPDHLREDVERYLQRMEFSQEALTAGLVEAMRYSLLAPGKRIRPVLALATARAVGLTHEQVLPLAGAIEEAVESAKTFCGADAPAFVNGVLAAVLREVRENARIR